MHAMSGSRSPNGGTSITEYYTNNDGPLKSDFFVIVKIKEYNI